MINNYNIKQARKLYIHYTQQSLNEDLQIPERLEFLNLRIRLLKEIRNYDPDFNSEESTNYFKNLKGAIYDRNRR